MAYLLSVVFTGYKNQPDTPLFFNPSNTTFDYSSTHDDCSLTLELDETSNTSVSVLLLDELKEWITARKSSVSSKIEYEVLKFFNGLNGEEVTIDRGAREVNREFDMVAFLNIAVIIGFVISILIALSNRSGIAIAVAVITGFIFFIVLLSGKKNRYHFK